MCVEVLVKRGEEEITCETVGELASALHLRPIEVSLDTEEDDCLCNMRYEDLKARRATEEEGFPWPEYIIDLNGSL
jgi:hypothetical protein